MLKNEKANAVKSKPPKNTKLSFRNSIKLLGTDIMSNEMLKAKLLAKKRQTKA